MLEQELNIYWKTVVNTIQDGIMIVDKSGTIVSVNNALGKMTQYKKDEMIGKPCSIINCDICELARHETRGHWCRLFSQGELNMRRCTIMSKDGSCRG